MELPNFSYETELLKNGLKIVAGVDEVGRGSFAGPVVAAACAFGFPHSFKGQALQDSCTISIDDSKKMKPREREKAAKWIKENTLAWGIGEASASLINRIGIARATRMAFRRAIASANAKLEVKSDKIDFLLIDAFYIPYVRGLRHKQQEAIIDGDQKSLSIAAASIIAKVYRDKIMTSLGRQSKFKRYGWGRNKGYGTRKHQDTIKKCGLTRYHRKVFVRTFLEKS